MNRAIYDRSKPTKNLVTTITGIVTLLISALSLFEVLTAEQGAELTGYVTTIVTAIAGVIAIFKSEDSAINLPRGKGKYVAVILVLLAMSSVNLQAQDSKWKGFFRPVEASDIVTVGTKSPNSAWKIRPTATLVATSYTLKFDEAGQFVGFNPSYLSSTGMGLSYAHYIISNGVPYNNYSINALLLLPTIAGQGMSIAGTVSAFEFLNLGVGYQLNSGAFKEKLFFLTGVSITF